jgi:hypothetical protein
MPKKKTSRGDDGENKKGSNEETTDEEAVVGGEDAIDPAIIEDTFSDDYSEYNDVDNF